MKESVEPSRPTDESREPIDPSFFVEEARPLLESAKDLLTEAGLGMFDIVSGDSLLPETHLPQETQHNYLMQGREYMVMADTLERMIKKIDQIQQNNTP